ncbi:MAG TPA: ATP F0F1 synthase subunit B [Xanthobacteraceae bacterium]|jgi:F-type H+-transporting ATPase subunit b
MLEAETWVAVATLIFLGVLVYFRFHTSIVGNLDQRAARIKSELEEARRIKLEAQALLAESERKQREADQEAEALIAGARAEAERLALEAKAKLEEFVSRRSKAAEAKIVQAEAQALADVRAAAAEAAVKAAERILTRTVKGKVADELIDRGVEELKSKLN